MELTKSIQSGIQQAHKDMKLARDYFKHEIGYVSAKLDTKRDATTSNQTDINIMRDRNQTKFDNMSTTIIQLAQGINTVLKTLE